MALPLIIAAVRFIGPRVVKMAAPIVKKAVDKATPYFSKVVEKTGPMLKGVMTSGLDQIKNATGYISRSIQDIQRKSSAAVDKVKDVASKGLAFARNSSLGQGARKVVGAVPFKGTAKFFAQAIAGALAIDGSKMAYDKITDNDPEANRFNDLVQKGHVDKAVREASIKTLREQVGDKIDRHRNPETRQRFNRAMKEREQNGATPAINAELVKITNELKNVVSRAEAEGPGQGAPQIESSHPTPIAEEAKKVGMSTEDFVQQWEAAYTKTIKAPLEKIADWVEKRAAAADQAETPAQEDAMKPADAEGGMVDPALSGQGALADPALVDGASLITDQQEGSGKGGEASGGLPIVPDPQKTKNNMRENVSAVSDGLERLGAAKKAFAIKNIITNTSESVMQAAKSVAPPWNIPLIALAAARGAQELSRVKGQFHSGINKVPSTGTYLLEQGERVVDKRLNWDLSAYLRNQTQPNIMGAKVREVEDRKARIMAQEMSRSVQSVRKQATTNLNNQISLQFGDNPDPDAVRNNRADIEQALRDVYAHHVLPDPFGD